MFLKSDTGIDYANDKKTSVFDSTPAILLEQFATFDDSKNNNRESNMLKERQKTTKSNIECDVNNYAKTIDLYKTGNLTKIDTHDKYTLILPINSPDELFLRTVERN